MRRLIVNGDDFGATHGINLGVIEAHERGVLTSASMMVDAPASEEAARLSASHPKLGLGLHVVLRSQVDSTDVMAEIERQLERFIELSGHVPTHIDSHHHVHRDRQLLPAFQSVAERHGLPLRGYCRVHHISGFYGQWNGETHTEHVSPGALRRIFATEIDDGFNELCCHPGYVDRELVSTYTVERESELESLCDPNVTAALTNQGIRLATFREVSQK